MSYIGTQLFQMQNICYNHLNDKIIDCQVGRYQQHF